MNLRYFTKISLLSVRFSAATDFDVVEQINVNLTTSPHIQYQIKQKLRSPRFELLNTETEKLGKGVALDTNFSTVLQAVDEVMRGAFDVASFRELNKFLRYNLQSYAQKWQQRAIKVVLYGVFVNNAVSELLQRNQRMFKFFNESIGRAGNQARESIVDLGEMLKTLRATVEQERNVMVEEAKNQVVAYGLILGFLVELGLVGITMLFVHCKTATRRKLRKPKRHV
jgi:hypothetical protein